MRRCTVLTVLTAGAVLGACGGSPDTDDTAATDAPAAAATADAPSAGTASADGARDRGTVPIEITAVVGGRTYSVAGTGECTHTEQASIYDVRAAQWRASYSGSGGDLRYVNLTIWQPAAGGADQANLSLRIGDTDHRIATVQGGEIVGKGTASAARTGGGGTLTVEGEDATGTAVRVTAECARVDVPVAEGG